MVDRVLHVVDGSTGGDAMEMLAGLLARGGGGGGEQKVVAMGHRGTGLLAQREGVVGEVSELEFVASGGWADPSGWRGVKRVIAAYAPTHVQAWGAAAVAAVEAAGFGGGKSAVFAEVPKWGHLRLLRVIDGGKFLGAKKKKWTWVGSLDCVVRGLVSAGLDGARVVRVRAGIGMGGKNIEGGPLGLRRRLGIAADAGPVILLGGEGRSARHDVGLWIAATLQQFFPKLLVIVREDIQGKRDIGLERLMGTLPDEEMLVLADGGYAWNELVQAADLVLMTPRPREVTPMGCVLHAMAAGVVVAGMPVECVAELVQQGHTGLLGKAARTREMVARIEEYMSDSTMKWGLTDRARAAVYGEYSMSGMVEGMRRVWAGEVG